MIIDFHTHCFNDQIVGRAMAALQECSSITPFLDGTLLDLKKSMKKAGVDKSVVLSIATKPGQSRGINEWSKNIDDDEIIAFGSVHPLNTDWENELEYIKSLGLRGIKLHPDYQNFFIDDRKMLSVYEKAAELGLIIVVHAGMDIGLKPPYKCTPSRLKKVLEYVPKATFVAAHLGGFSYWDEVLNELAGRNIYFDTSYSIGWIEEKLLLRIFEKHDKSKILFGTDSPWCHLSSEVSKIEMLDIKTSFKEAILGENAKNLLERLI